MKTRLLLATLATATALFSLPALAADSAQDFVNKAAMGGMFEVDSSKVATEKANDQDVKDFAQKMIADHGAANAKLESIAGSQKLTVPKALDAKQEGDLETLRNSEPPVDAPYVGMQREAHSDAVALFESYASDGDNAELRTFAEETLPTLKMHQDMIEKIAATMDGQPAADAATSTAPTAPVPGANSFTEDQAKARIQDAGFAEVSELIKDDKGIWRGHAKRDGKSTDVALDYQGNIFAGSN